MTEKGETKLHASHLMRFLQSLGDPLAGTQMDANGYACISPNFNSMLSCTHHLLCLTTSLLLCLVAQAQGGSTGRQCFLPAGGAVEGGREARYSFPGIAQGMQRFPNHTVRYVGAARIQWNSNSVHTLILCNVAVTTLRMKLQPGIRPFPVRH